MAAKQPLCPAFGNGQIVNVATTSTAITLTAPSMQLVLTNQGANFIYVRCIPGAATTADMPVPPGEQIVISKFYDQLAITAIAVTGATNLHVMPCEGFGSL